MGKTTYGDGSSRYEYITGGDGLLPNARHHRRGSGTSAKSERGEQGGLLAESPARGNGPRPVHAVVGLPQ